MAQIVSIIRQRLTSRDPNLLTTVHYFDPKTLITCSTGSYGNSVVLNLSTYSRGTVSSTAPISYIFLKFQNFHPDGITCLVILFFF